MPLVNIWLREGETVEYRKAIADGVHRAMVETIGVPEQDRFQIITEHDEAGLVYDPSYLGIHRTDEVVFIRITLGRGRTTEQKKALYATIAERLAQNPGVRPEDVLINLVENSLEDWSFGSGEAQYLNRPPQYLRR